MDNELSANDPYREMQTGEDEIRPDFLRNKSGGGAQKMLGAAEQLAAAKAGGAGAKGKKAGEAGAEGAGGIGKGGKAGEAGAGLKGEKIGTGDAKNTDSATGAGGEEKSSRGLFTGGKKGKKASADADKGGNLKMPSALKLAAPFLIILLAIFGIIAVIVALPVFMIGAIDYNLQQALGFTGTVGILEEQAEHVTAEFAKNGDFPAGYSSDLARNGVDVGQVTANGDFIKTDVYIANIEDRDDLVAAASGFSYISEDEGELALLYDGKIIRADDFVAEVESDPKLYAAFSKATNITSRYYYGEDASKVITKMGLVRGAFNNWEQTGDYDTDLASFTETLNQLLDGNDTTLGLGAVRDDVPPSKWTPDCYVVKGGGSCVEGDTYLEYPITTVDSSEIISTIANQTRGYITSWKDDTCEDPRDETKTLDCETINSHDTATQTKRAAELLNTGVSAREPYIAGATFMATEEAIQRARIDGDGPVNLLMNIISTGVDVVYENVKTGEKVTDKTPIIETNIFQSLVGEKPCDKDEALNFSRDRTLLMTGQADAEIIKKTTISSNGGKNSTTAVRNGDTGPADSTTLMKADDAIAKAMTEKNSTVYQSKIGANRIPEGGHFASNEINMKVIAAMASDASTVQDYQKEVDTALERKAEAERASLSPFDISSPNTFLGSIVHNLATAAIGSYSSKSSSIATGLQATGGVAVSAMSDLLGTVKAESWDQKFTAMSPTDNADCATINTLAVAGDLYCNSHNTVNTDNMKNTLKDWQASAIGGFIGPDGEILENSDLEKFVIMGMGRESTVGVMNSEVCDAYHEYEDNFFQKFIHHIQDVVGVYNACDGVDEDVATGAKYSFSNQQDPNLKLYSGYMLYSEVRSLLKEEQSSLSIAQERYYSKHPQDNSEAGILARISGMTKQEAEIAIAYASYLNEIASYDASTRYFFGPIDLGLDDEHLSLEAHSAKIAGDYVAWYIKETEFEDLRSRNFVA